MGLNIEEVAYGQMFKYLFICKFFEYLLAYYYFNTNSHAHSTSDYDTLNGALLISATRLLQWVTIRSLART